MEENFKSTTFVRNVNVMGEWRQIAISEEERAKLQDVLLKEQAVVYYQAFELAKGIMQSIMNRPTNMMVHDLAMQMTNRTTAHIHLVYKHHLDKKARQLHEERQSKVEQKESIKEAEALASVFPGTEVIQNVQRRL